MIRRIASKRRPVVLYQPRDEGAAIPLGLLAVGSWLTDEHVVIVDGRFELAPEARVLELARDALCLGLTVRTGRPLRDALGVSAAVRAAEPELPIVWGGPHATYRPEECLETGVVDACIRGAGEEVFASCVKALHARSALEGLDGLALPGCPKGELHSPPAPARVPRVPYALIDLERYFDARGARRLDYCSSRGVPRATGGGWLGLPAERVVAEVLELDDRYGLAEILFRDEAFFADPDRAEAIARGLLAEGATTGWQVGARAEELLKMGSDTLPLLAESGCRKVHVRVTPGVAPEGAGRHTILGAGARLHAAGLEGRFAFAVDELEAGGSGLSAVESVARALCAMDSRFETPIRRHRVYPPDTAADEPTVAPDLAEWAEREDEPWTDRRAERRLARATFYFAEAQRPPGRRLGKRILRILALARVRLGFFGLDLDRLAVEASTLLRTGRRRGVRREE